MSINENEEDILVSKLTDIADQKANYLIPENIRDNIKILGVTGILVELNGETRVISPTTSQQIITPNSPYNGITQITINAVDASIDSNIQVGNIKSGVNILGVTGNYTEDADALVTDLSYGKTAYVNGNLVTGTLTNVQKPASLDNTQSGVFFKTADSTSNATSQYIFNDVNNSVNYFVSAIPVAPDGEDWIMRGQLSKLKVGIEFNKVASVLNITPDKVKAGTNIVGVTGNYTSDANATRLNIKNGVTAYVNGQKITGNLPVLTYPINPNSPTDWNYQFIAANTAKIVTRDGISYVLIDYQIAGNNDPDSWMFEGNRKMKMGVSYSQLVSVGKITAANIKKGVTIFGVTGTYNGT